MAKLYTPELLALSASLADFPLTGEFDAVGEARSRSCGSSIELGLVIDANRAVSRVGMKVSACAVGQSAAAIFARGVEGLTRPDLEQSLAQIDAWLSGSGELPLWPGFAALAPALEHKGRHDALRLPWRAGISALCSAGSPS